MTNPPQPTDSPAGIADGEIEEFSKLLEWHKVFHEAERNDDIGAVGRRVLDAVHEGFPSLIARLKRAEAERDRLKEALEPFAGMYKKHKYNNDGCLCPAYVSMPQVRAAAEALSPGSTENERSGLHSFGFGAALADAGKGGGE